MAEKKPKTYKLLRGVNYPKSKALRDRIRAGEATSAEIGEPFRKAQADHAAGLISAAQLNTVGEQVKKEWVRVEAGPGRKFPDDIAADLNARGLIEEED